MKRTDSEMIREIYTVLLGVDNSSDGGLVEKVNSIEENLRKINGKVQSNTAWRKALCWVVGLETGVLVTMATFLLVRM